MEYYKKLCSKTSQSKDDLVETLKNRVSQKDNEIQKLKEKLDRQEK